MRVRNIHHNALCTNMQSADMHAMRKLCMWAYLVGTPKAILSFPIVYGPAKSQITPSESHMPVCPMKGMSQVMGGSGDHTMQYGYRFREGSIGPGGGPPLPLLLPSFPRTGTAISSLSRPSTMLLCKASCSFFRKGVNYIANPIINCIVSR